MKKILSAAIMLSLLFSAVPSFAAETKDELNKTAQYVYENTPEPVSGSVGGEWAVFGLARSEYGVDSDYFLKYAENLQTGSGSTPEYLENPRYILALTAIGMNAADFKGKNLYAPLADTEKVTSFGVNAAAWALIALDCENYKADGAREKYIEFILSSALADGGFSYTSEGAADADVTAVVLQAISPYTERPEVKEAVNKALLCLSDKQEADGGFSSWGVKSAESTAQVITALNSLNIPLSDERFVKEKNLYDNLMLFSCGNGGFKHTAADSQANAMTTEQVLYALASLERAENGKTKLYDMSGVAKIRMPKFADISGSPYRSAIEILAEKGIINGVSDTEFNPGGNVTRAEYAAMVVRALGIENTSENLFCDVSENDWFYGSVCAAYGAGIINGVSATEFNPSGNITREESAAMTARTAEYAGIDAGTPANGTDLAAKEYADFNSVSEWAKEPVGFCFASKITSFITGSFLPKKELTREETAQIIYTLLSL